MLEQAKNIIERLKIKFSLDELIEFKKVYIYLNTDKKILRIHVNKIIDGKQVKAQVYNLKKNDSKKDYELEQIYLDCVNLCSIIEEIKLTKKIEKERLLRENLVYDNQLLSFVK